MGLSSRRRPLIAPRRAAPRKCSCIVAWSCCEHRRGEQYTSPQSTAEACTDSRLKSSGSLQSEQLASPIKALASNKRSLHRLERSFFLVRTACVLCRACLLCPVRGICCPSSHPFHSLLLESFRHASGSLSAIMTQLQWRAPPKSGH